MGQVVGGASVTQAGDRGGEGCGGPVAIAVGPGQAGAGQVAFGPQHRGQVPGLVRVEQGDQLAGGRVIAQFVSRASGERPGPA